MKNDPEQTHRDDGADSHSVTPRQTEGDPTEPMEGEPTSATDSRDEDSSNAALATGDYRLPGVPRHPAVPVIDSILGQEGPKTFGRYQVLGLRGTGSFGAVYLAYDPPLDRQVAVKVPKLRGDSPETEDFLREARKLARLKHPGIVAVYDTGVEGGACYIVSDFVQGESLERWIEGRR